MSQPVRLAAIGLAALLALAACDQINDAIDDNKGALDVPVSTTWGFPFTMDLGQATGALAGQKAPEAKEHDLSTPAVDVDLVAEAPALANAKGRVKRLEITALTITPTANTVTGKLPAFDIYIGPKGATKPEDAVKIATVPSIEGGSTAAISAPIDSAGMEAAQPHLTSLAFAQLVVAKLAVAKGDDVPGGKADLTVDLALKATLNPLQ